MSRRRQKEVTNKPNLKSVSFPRHQPALLQNILENACATRKGEIGKSIVFAVSQHHAAKLTQILMRSLI